MSHSGFLRAICERPRDLDVRLIFADWLEDGDPAHAEFIRLQCALSKPYRCPGTNRADLCFWCSNAVEIRSMSSVGPNYKECGKRCYLRWRERELLNRPCVPGGKTNYEWWFTPFDEESHLVPGTLGGTHKKAFLWTYRNGFVYSVSCTQADWIAHGKEIVQVQPIEDVRLTDVQPWSNFTFGTIRNQTGLQRSQTWNLRGTYHLAPDLCEELSSAEVVHHASGDHVYCYPSQDAALSDLSRACVSWARSQAHLPALEER